MGRTGWNLHRRTDMDILTTDETKINLYEIHGKAKMWIKKGLAYNPKHISSTVMYAGCKVMACA